MPTKVTIELDHEGMRQLLSSDEMAGAVRGAAEKVATVAGDGFEVTDRQQLWYGGGRVGYGVRAATYKAKLAEAKDKALSRAVSACRS